MCCDLLGSLPSGVRGSSIAQALGVKVRNSEGHISRLVSEGFLTFHLVFCLDVFGVSNGKTSFSASRRH